MEVLDPTRTPSPPVTSVTVSAVACRSRACFSDGVSGPGLLLSGCLSLGRSATDFAAWILICGLAERQP